MAKVMVSMPDELLARVDAEARRSGRSRSAVLRESVASSFRDRRARLGQEMKLVNADAESHGGDVVEALKAGRPR